jgi:DNA (cytosine-5)-methyltransferase 1
LSLPEVSLCLTRGTQQRMNAETETLIPTTGAGFDELIVPAWPADVGVDCYNGEIAGDVAATMGTRGSSVNSTGPTVLSAAGFDVAHSLRGEGFDAMAVRRLTPRECEALQGFSPNYTAIPWRNRPADQCPDGPRYKALGNSMAVPCMRWIGERIQKVEAQMQRKADAA